MADRGAEARRYVVLDGLRGLAALCVITDHVDAGFLTAALPGRYLAVDFFFVLSGFVLSHVYGARLASGMGVWGFMRMRLIRLYPLYLVGLLAGFSLALVHALRWGLDAAETLLVPFALNLAILPAFSWVTYPFDAPAWSLFFELVVNLAFAALFVRLSTGAMWAILALSTAGLVASALIFDSLDGGWTPANFLIGFPRVFFGFFAGVLINRVSLRWSLPALPSWLSYALLLALLALPAITPLERTWTDLAVIVIGCPALLALSAGASGAGWLERALGWLGAMSYGVYILHVPIIAWLMAMLRFWAPSFHIPGVAFLALVVATAVSATAILEIVYDRPVRAWLSRRVTRSV